MKPGMLLDGTLRTMQIALDGLSLRQNIISNNIANIDTPGFQAQKLDFESALKRAQRANDIDLANNVVGQSKFSFQLDRRQGNTPRSDGNTVSIDQELVEMSETVIRFQTLSRLTSSKLGLYKEIASRR